MLCMPTSFCAAVVFCLLVSNVSAGELVLAENGQSAYKIVVADNASPSTKHGADELQMFFEQITGVKLPIVSDQQPQTAKEIILGENAHLKAISTPIDFAALGNEGYVIRTVGDSLVIAGGSLRGNMYGVYGLLEDHWSCRWFAPGASHIPKMPRLAINEIDDRQVPALEYRSLCIFKRSDGDWCARNRMNSSEALDEKHGGKVTFGDNFFCHTFAHLVPVDKYFDAHPEYFSLVGGTRRKVGTQLCCTNSDVIRICSEAIYKAMQAQPDATVFSVSQNDDVFPCECPNCQALVEQEGTQMAPVLHLVNCVAEAVEKDFPDKLVETLAYQWTRKPPKTMRPRPNVVVRLGSIECCFTHPLKTCDSEVNQRFRSDLEGWAKVSTRLWIWDYATDFMHYLLPFPNQRVRGPNIHFFIDNNVKGIFELDTYNTDDGELTALGGYITAKCLWNPNYDADLAMNEFLDGFYGKAATPIRAYLDLIHDRVERENIHVGIWAGAESPHLNEELLTKADQLWQQAEDLASGQPELLDRVQRSRMSVDYGIMERARLQVPQRSWPPASSNILERAGLQAKQKPPANEAFLQLAAARFKPFCDILDRSSIVRLHENIPTDKAAYRRDLAKELGIEEK